VTGPWKKTENLSRLFSYRDDSLLRVTNAVARESERETPTLRGRLHSFPYVDIIHLANIIKAAKAAPEHYRIALRNGLRASDNFPTVVADITRVTAKGKEKVTAADLGVVQEKWFVDPNDSKIKDAGRVLVRNYNGTPRARKNAQQLSVQA